MRNNYELLDIRAFLALMSLGSFNAAAEKLNMSQPAFSRRIGHFEDTLGVKLFERTTRSVRPTRVAEQYQPAFARLLNELDAISSLGATSGPSRETVVIACVFSAAVKFLPSLISDFLSKNSGVEFSILDVSANEALEAVSTGEAHFGVTILTGSYPSLTFIPVMSDPFVFICHRSHALAGRKYVTGTDLAGHRLIQFQNGSYNRTIIDLSTAPSNLDLDWTVKVNHLSTAIGLVDAGVGASIMPHMMVEAVNSPNVVAIELREPKMTRTIGIVEKKGRVLASMAKEFRDFLNSEWPDGHAKG